MGAMRLASIPLIPLAALSVGVLGTGCAGGSGPPYNPEASGARLGPSHTSSDGGPCAVIAPCGGNIVGTWHPANVCSPDLIATIGSCQAKYATQSGGTGTLTYGSDGTWSSDGTSTTTTTFTVPAACIATFGASSCAELHNSGISGTCAPAPGGVCECATPDPPFTTGTNGTYTASGTTVTVTAGGSDTFSYCVDDAGALHELSSIDAGPLTSRGDSVFVK